MQLKNIVKLGNIHEGNLSLEDADEKESLSVIKLKDVGKGKLSVENTSLF